MRKSEFKDIVKKYVAGKASREEENALSQYFEKLQKHKEWNNSLMGDPDDVQKALFGRISADIDQIEKKGTFTFSKWQIAASIIVLLTIGIAGYRYKYNTYNPDSLIALQTTTGNGQIIKITLTDGTKVWLNAGSTLHYSSAFTGSKREVTLIGEAYFEVSHDEKKPFIIHSGELSTQVLGTSFNIKAYKNGKNITVAVLTGKVGVMTTALNSGKKQKVEFVTPNEEIVYHKSQDLMERRTVDAALSISWKTGTFHFRNTPFEEVITALERNYNVQISYNEELKNCPVHADFNSNEDVYKVLRLLSGSINGQIERTGDNHYHITGKSCN